MPFVSLMTACAWAQWTAKGQPPCSRFRTLLIVVTFFPIYPPRMTALQRCPESSEWSHCVSDDTMCGDSSSGVFHRLLLWSLKPGAARSDMWQERLQVPSQPFSSLKPVTQLRSVLCSACVAQVGSRGFPSESHSPLFLITKIKTPRHLSEKNKKILIA